MTEIDEKPKFDNSKETIKKYAKDWKLEIVALIGFCISGVIFIVSGIQNGNLLTILGSSVWIVSCLIWMIPYRRYFDISYDKSDCKYNITTQINSDK